MRPDTLAPVRIPPGAERRLRGGPPRAVAARRLALVLGLAGGLAGACAEKPLPEIPAMPVAGWEYVAELEPDGSALPPAARDRLGTGWEQIRTGRLREAEGVLASLLAEFPDDPGVLAAAGYLELRLGRPEGAEPRFEAALDRDPASAFAALGSVLVRLDGGDADADEMFPRLRRLAALSPDSPAVAALLPDVEREIADRRLDRAREASSAAAVVEAYRAALEVIPESSDLVFEAAEAAAAAGDREQALAWFGQVADDPGAAQRDALVSAIGAARLLADAGRLTDSLARLDQARGSPELASHSDLEDRVRELSDRLAYARLTERFDRIRETERGTREQLAAVLALELGIPEAGAGGTNGDPGIVIAVDLERSWAADQILAAVGAGYMRIFPDNTFKPRDYVTRAELAESLAAALAALHPGRHRAALRQAGDVALEDVPEGHRQRDVVALAVGLGLLSGSEGRFRPRDFASGADILRAVRSLKEQFERGAPPGAG